ncbi:hypothetical protein EUGRSUZ_F03485 [Eucalyptus grandis]|uniref:Uncharacterized protein n=2 Tax=Eucalyptus grandis TaxID=71139 RepID=A0ACC3KL74_EUCGR|nr:hypothetical protein EUGRSUZ_F03485 [Eucalyptus grandis]
MYMQPPPLNSSNFGVRIFNMVLLSEPSFDYSCPFHFSFRSCILVHSISHSSNPCVLLYMVSPRFAHEKG